MFGTICGWADNDRIVEFKSVRIKWIFTEKEMIDMQWTFAENTISYFSMLTIGKPPLNHSAAPNIVAVTVDCKWILMGNVPYRWQMLAISKNKHIWQPLERNIHINMLI